jgi:hypothetical protein
VVGFDSKWDVELAPQGFVCAAGNTAILQVAYQQHIYILQVGIQTQKSNIFVQ